MTRGSAREAARVLAIGATLLLAACSSTRPCLNVPAAAPASSIVVAIALSGAGARASAFGLGVLKELKATRFTWQGPANSLLDEVGLVSGVSDASVLAAYYVAFGDETFTRFKRDFLTTDSEYSTAPGYGRKLERLYRGATFADLSGHRSGPRLLVTATDLTTGAAFEFTPEQFALICSDLSSVPLSVAVTASSALPPFLSPVSLANYAGGCAHARRDGAAAMVPRLMDGSLVDNLGVRGLLARALAADWPDRPAGSVRKIVLISVSSERDAGGSIGGNDEVPRPLQVLDALAFGAGAWATQEAIAAMKETVRRSPLSGEAEIQVISVSLRDLKDEKTRDALLRIPTALPLSPLQVDQLEEAGRTVLRQSFEFRQLRDALAAP